MKRLKPQGFRLKTLFGALCVSAVIFFAGCSTPPPAGTGRTVTFPDPQLQYSDPAK